MALVLDGNGSMTVGNGDITGLATGALPSEFIGAGALLQTFNTTIPETSLSNATTTTMFNVSFAPKVAGSIIVGFVNWNSVTGVAGTNSNLINYGYYYLGTSSTPASNSLIQTTSLQPLGTDNDDNLSHLHIFRGVTGSTATHYISGRIFNNSSSSMTICRHSNTGPVIFFEIAP
jgi:hypothetical protein